MEKLMTKNVLNKPGFLRAAFIASVGFSLIFASNAFAQLPAPAAPAPPPAGAPPAEVERVIVTGSNIPTAEETGPNPVDTYRPQDIEKLGIRNATDLQEFIPQENGRRDEPACERVQNERFVGALSSAIRRSALGLVASTGNLTQSATISERLPCLPQAGDRAVFRTSVLARACVEAARFSGVPANRHVAPTPTAGFRSINE